MLLDQGVQLEGEGDCDDHDESSLMTPMVMVQCLTMQRSGGSTLEIEDYMLNLSMTILKHDSTS